MTRARDEGQALVEFALAVIPFLILLMGVIDLGRGIYTMNGTSEAARDITRATIVHLTGGGGQLGMSDQTTDVIAKQQSLIPGLTIDPATDIECVDAYDVVQNDDISGDELDCNLGVDFIRVRVTADFSPITPLVSAFGTHTFESTSRMQIP
ncbi:MAG TPA: TadE family protein [Candidatus Limnocylindrales bacterium]|nr:TadE family protein [Candidatus Limnocylindrales bacterium]